MGEKDIILTCNAKITVLAVVKVGTCAVVAELLGNVYDRYVA